MTKPIDARLMFIAGQMLIRNVSDIDRPTKKDIREHNKRVIDWAKEIADIAREIRKPVASDERYLDNLAKLTQESQDMGLYDPPFTNPMIKASDEATETRSETE